MSFSGRAWGPYRHNRIISCKTPQIEFSVLSQVESPTFQVESYNLREVVVCQKRMDVWIRDADMDTFVSAANMLQALLDCLAICPRHYGFRTEFVIDYLFSLEPWGHPDEDICDAVARTGYSRSSDFLCLWDGFGIPLSSHIIVRLRDQLMILADFLEEVGELGCRNLRDFVSKESPFQIAREEINGQSVVVPKESWPLVADIAASIAEISGLEVFGQAMVNRWI